MSPQAQILARVRFRTPEEGGRRTPIIGGSFSCPLFIDGGAFECRVYFHERELVLGECYELQVQFLHPEFLKEQLVSGKSFVLWEGKIIAEGQVLKSL